MKIRKVCLDLDDTVIPNTYKYHKPTWECGMIVEAALGLKSMYPPALLNYHAALDKAMVDEIDPDTGRKFGFSQERFPKGWIRAYEQLAAKAGAAIDPKVSERLYRTACQFREGPFDMFPGGHDALSEIRDMVEELHLITAGDERLQWKKIDECGARDLFSKIHVTPMKKKEILAQISGERPDACLMAGDSKKSDIVPAVELGIHAVWIPSQTWDFADADVDPSKYHQLPSITELPDLIRRIG